MTDEELLQRIILDPQIMAGKPAIRGTRLTVEHILKLLAHGTSMVEILPENTAFKLLLQLAQQAHIRQFRGKLHWEGNLNEMRQGRFQRLESGKNCIYGERQ